VLIVFCIQLIALNWNSGDKEGEFPVTDGSPTGSAEDPDGSGEQDTEPPDDSELPDEGLEGEGAQQNGGNQTTGVKLFELLMLDEVNLLTLSADEGLFRYTEDDAVWLFTYLGEGEASFRVSDELLAPQGGVSGHAESLMEYYLDGAESPVGLDRQIANSSLRAVYIVGEKNGETHEVWVRPLLNGNEGHAHVLVFIANYSNAEQKDAIYSILDTLELSINGEEQEEE